MMNSFQTNQSSYMYNDVTPIIPDINLESLKLIEEKLKAYTSGNNAIGLNKEELDQFLNWVTFNARSYAVRNIPISKDNAILSEPMTGQCAPTQNINVKLLRKLGLDIRPFNMGECIEATNIPMSPKDIQKINNGWFSTAVRHSISIVTLPILIPSGEVKEYDFLLDPTFRQFCFKEYNQKSQFTDANWLSKGYVAPHPAYFMPENLCKELIMKGYILLTPGNAKLYGDAFQRASVRAEYQDFIPNTTGEEYLNYFKNIPIDLIGNIQDEKQYALLPSEIENMQNRKVGFFKRLFKRIFGQKTSNKLPSANFPSNSSNFKDESFTIPTPSTTQTSPTIIAPNKETQEEPFYPEL